MAPWLYLLAAAGFEIAWAVGLKYTEGFTRLWPSVLVIAGMIASFFLLAQAVRNIPIGTGYAIWTGIGAVGAAAFGVILFHEPVSWQRLACIALIVAGIVGLKLTTPA
jgi:quaternary ammonium compound-resistance protein SugE